MEQLAHRIVGIPSYLILYPGGITTLLLLWVGWVAKVTYELG